MSQHVRFTACLITYNEEANVGEALQSIAFADEIIVVDSRSTDRTREVAAGFRGKDRLGRPVEPRVLERDWPGHVEQKNFAVEQATHDWVFCLDADERVSPELREEVEAVLDDRDTDAVGYSMPRKTWYLGRWILRGGWYPDRKLRLFHRGRGRWGGTNPHDHVHVEGRVVALRGDLLHYSYRGLEDHLRTINFFTDVAAQEKFSRGQRFTVIRMLTHPPFKFFNMYVIKQGFREGVAGLIIALLGMFYVFLKYAKLWELHFHEWRDASPVEVPEESSPES